MRAEQEHEYVTAVGVNASGLVVGIHGRMESRRAAVVVDGAVVDLPTPAGALLTDAVGVNAGGEVAGIAYFSDQGARAVVWPANRGKAKVLQAGGAQTRAAGIADDGTVVGTLGERERPYRWAPDGSGAALALPEGYRGGEGMKVAGDWAVGAASTSRGGADGKEELTAQITTVRWNLRTGALDHGFRMAIVSVSTDGTVAGRVGKELPGIWRDGTVLSLPIPVGAVRGEATAVVGDGHSMIGWSTGPGGPKPLIWRGC